MVNSLSKNNIPYRTGIIITATAKDFILVTKGHTDVE